MSAAEVDALLERLVAQFESPYDFLRELVQNAMDAGSDRVEIKLESHPLRAEVDSVVFELTVIDAGAGMDEAIIDQELTRLFASSKSGDRTMAGGFGIGFVSVFAWEPEAVLVMVLGGVLHESLIHHSLADLDHSVGSKTCAVCQVLQHNANLVSGMLIAEPVLLVQSDAFTPLQSVPSSSAPAPFASRAPPVLS